MEKLGRTAPLLRRLRRLRRDAGERAVHRELVAEGPRLVAEALRSGVRIECAVLTDRLLEREPGRELVEALRMAQIPLFEVTASVMDGLQDARSPQPILALVDAPSNRVLPPLDEGAWVVVACGVQDPGNLGTLMRTAEAAGAAAFVAAGDCADLRHPRTVRASAGAVFRLPTVVWPLDAAIASLQGRGLRFVAADAAGGEVYHDVQLCGPLAVCFGAEAAGLPDELLQVLDAKVHIPLRPPVESLSVGAAAAIVLFEVARQRAVRE